MSTILVDVSDDTIKLLDIGFQGENSVEQVNFDISSWADEYGAGIVTLYVKRKGDGEPYFVELPVSDNIATWTISNIDTANKGNGKAQLNYIVNSAVKKTVLYPIRVKKSLLDAGEEIPDPYDDWLEEIRQGVHTVEDFAESLTEEVNDWLAAHPEATTTVQDGAITTSKLNNELLKSVEEDGLKKIWSIQTNSNSAGTFYGLAASSDGYGHNFVDGYYNFLDVEGRNLGTDWVHFQHGNYHVFTITHKTATVDFYIAITKDFEEWTHKPIEIGFSSASGFTDPYVWTPQIFEFGDKLYIAATVQEGEPVQNGDIYGITLLRKSGIYIAEITLDYDTASVFRTSEFTRVAFGNIHDKTGASHDVSGNAMDAWFVPVGSQLFCVFSERCMQEIHTAVASSITDTFTILAENIFNMPYTEAPTVLQINDNLWKISACLWSNVFSAEEENLCCYTSDFETFFHYGIMKRVDVSSASSLYSGRMRNPSFFYMTDEQEHNFCINHEVHTEGYNHIFKPTLKRMTSGYKSLLTYTDVDLQPNVNFAAVSSNFLTLSDTFFDLVIDDCVGIRAGDFVDCTFVLGNTKLNSGTNVIGTIPDMFKPTKAVYFVAYAGTGTALGTALRGAIVGNEVRLFPANAFSGYNTIRFSCCYSIL